MIFDSLFNMINYYNNNMTDNEKLSVSNTIRSEEMYFHIYKLSNNTTFESNNDINDLMSLCTENDTYTQVIIGNNITINNTVTFTPPYRCKGLIIYDFGTFTNNGIVSMTARGANAVGQNIYIIRQEYIPANGEAGGAEIYCGNWEQWSSVGNNGTNGTSRKTGGGGGGGYNHGNAWGGYGYSGAGSAGTSYSGGTGGGSSGSTAGGYVAHADRSGKPNGGAGGVGYGSSGTRKSSFAPHSHGGGAGNPAGAGTVWWTNSEIPTVTPAQNGTGGLLVIYSNKFQNYGSITSNGSNGGYGNGGYSGGGGGSGGGSVNIYYNQLLERGTITATGGTGGIHTSRGGGGNGGNGSVTLTPLQYTYTINSYLQNLSQSDYFLEEQFSFLDFDYNSHKKSYDGFTLNNVQESFDNDNLVANINIYYTRNTYTLTVNHGTSHKYTYLYEEQGDLHYDRYPTDFLHKFKNWISDVPANIDIAYLHDTFFKMPASDVTISVEFVDQDRVNTNIYKNIFDSFLFDLYNFQTILNGPYKQETTIFQYNHEFQVYDLLRLNQSGLYEKGIAIESKYDVIGMVTQVLNDHEFVLTTYGPIETNISFSSDSGILYLSDTQEGKFCTYEELVSNFYTPIGFYTGNTITLNILDSSVGDVLKKYFDTVYEHEQDLPHITETEKQDIIQEVFNNA